MTGQFGAPRRGDPATKWLIGGTVLSFGMMLGFIAGMSDQLRIPGSGPGPIMVMVMLGVGAFVALATGPVGRAVGKRILEGGQAGGDAEAALREIEDLRLQAEDLRNALAETQERMDFAERLIAGTKDRLPEELH